MWNISNRRKNTYLQSRVQVLDPALLNKCVEKARGKSDKIYPKKMPFKEQLLPLEPKSIISQPERSKTPLTYGLLGLPRVLKEMSVKNLKIQCSALNTLTDLLANPFELYRAICEFDIVKRLEAILLYYTSPHKENIRVIDLILINLAYVAEKFEGAWRMIVRYEVMDTLYCLIKTSKCLKDEAANIFKLLSSHPSVVDVMLIQGHLNRTHNLIKQHDNIINVYIYLSNLLERAPTPGMELLTFDFLIAKLCNRDKFLPYVLKCLAFLLNTAEGHDFFDRIDAVLILYNLLKDDTVDGMLLENTVLALKNCTIRKISLWRCREFWDLPIILVKHAHNRENDILQLYCLQTLRQLTVMPSVKNFVRKVCKKHIKKIECRQDFVSTTKKALLEWLRKKTYRNVEPIDESDEEDKNVDEGSSESETITNFKDWSRNIDKKAKNVETLNPNPIAYRLDYGHICAEKPSSKLSLHSSQQNHPICSNSLTRFLETASVLKTLHDPMLIEIGNPILDLEEKIKSMITENAPKSNPPVSNHVQLAIPQSPIFIHGYEGHPVHNTQVPFGVTPSNTPLGRHEPYLSPIDMLLHRSLGAENPE